MAVSEEFEQKLSELTLSYYCVLKNYSANDDGRVTIKLKVPDDDYVRAARTKLYSKQWLALAVGVCDEKGAVIQRYDLGYVMFQHLSAGEEEATVTLKSDLENLTLTQEQQRSFKKKSLRVTLLPETVFAKLEEK